MVTFFLARVATIVTILLIVPLPACWSPPAPNPTPELGPAPTKPMNLDFEAQETTHAAYYWTPEGGPYDTEFAEINTPVFWTSFWFEGFKCPGTAFWRTGRPEVGLITRQIDKTRVRNGERALKLFTFHRCHIAGVQQRFKTRPGQAYRLSAYAHAWYTNCSSKPHYTECALDWDCSTCFNSYHQFLVGLDPYGGINPYNPTVLWSSPHTIYGQYGPKLEVQAAAKSEAMTIYLVGIAPLPMRHCDDYWDQVQIEEVQVYYIPMVTTGSEPAAAPVTREEP
jgi:hypothetical protein